MGLLKGLNFRLLRIKWVIKRYDHLYDELTLISGGALNRKSLYKDRQFVGDIKIVINRIHVTRSLVSVKTISDLIVLEKEITKLYGKLGLEIEQESLKS